MLTAKARWIQSPCVQEAADRLAEELKLQPLVARLLVVRGITEPEDARRFLQGGAEQFHNPYLLKGMTEAVARIRLALERGERIRVYGDYDADGISSTTLMTRLMTRLGAHFDTYIPHRVLEGYGLNRGAMELAREQGITLVITVDTGISARDEIAYAQELGIDVIVTDHHEPPELLPDAAAVVNPKQSDCPYPFKHLAGVGVAFKLAQALLGEPPLEWLEIAAIGTVADIMPLKDENRVIVRLGLSQMRNTSNVGLRALLAVSGVERSEVNETHIGFGLAPRINASGRLQHADLAVKLLTTESEQEAETLAQELDALNKERQKLVEEMAKEALAQMAVFQAENGPARVLVAEGPGWNVGVVGIVASRLLDKYYRPALVLAVNPETGMAKGSARSIAGFDIFQALNACSDLLEHYGGHQAAAGLSLKAEHIGELRVRLNRLAEEWLTEEDLLPILSADAACCVEDASLASIEQLAKLAPFGNGNPAPRFIFEGLRLQEKRTMGKEQQHLKLTLGAAQAAAVASIEAVGFGYGAASERIAPTARVDVLGELTVNEWNGVKKPQIMIQDLRVPHPQVFDWRGAKASGRGRLPQLPEGAGIVVFAPDEDRSLPLEWASAAVWRCEGAGEPTPLNDPARQQSFATLRDVVLYTLPPFEETIAEALGALQRVERVYAVFAEAGAAASSSFPDREAFKTLYGLLHREERLPADDDHIYSGLAKRTGLSQPTVHFILSVFEELGFIQRDGTQWAVVRPPAKRDLTESTAYRRRQNRETMEQSYIYTTSLELTGVILSKIASKEIS